MTAQDDRNFYEKKERLLHLVQEGTATQAQKDWLIHWGFLERSKLPLSPTYGNPTRTRRVYRYRGPMKATPIAKVEGPGGPGTHINRHGKLVADPKWKRVKPKNKKLS